LAAEDILLEGSHGDIAIWPSNRGEVAPDASLGDTAVEYLLGDVVAAVLSFVAGSEARRGVTCVMVNFCSNGLVTARRKRTGHRPSEAIIEKDLQDYEDACHGHISYLPDLCFRLRWIRRIEKMLDGCSLVHLQKEKGCRDGQMVSHHMNRTEW
jgi:hypothetical protein